MVVTKFVNALLKGLVKIRFPVVLYGVELGYSHVGDIVMLVTFS